MNFYGVNSSLMILSAFFNCLRFVKNVEYSLHSIKFSITFNYTVWILNSFVSLNCNIVKNAYVFSAAELFKFMTNLKLSNYEPILSNKHIDRIIIITNCTEPFSQTQRKKDCFVLYKRFHHRLKSAYEHIQAPRATQ